MSQETKLKDTLKEIFLTGKTEMGVVWLMLIIGMLFGIAVRSCR